MITAHTHIWLGKVIIANTYTLQVVYQWIGGGPSDLRFET